jgi:hypothetical protein
MNKARKSGYYMSLMPIKLINSTAYIPISNTQYAGGYVVNLTIVGDSDLYMVDPTSPSGYLKLISMQGELKWDDTIFVK